MVAINMEIPSCCGECNLSTCKGKDEPWNYCCSITLTNINLDNTERPSDCPLVEIEERKVGKWDILACDLYMCSKCYAKFTHEFNYCPNCGAEMRGAENG